MQNKEDRHQRRGQQTQMAQKLVTFEYNDEEFKTPLYPVVAEQYLDHTPFQRARRGPTRHGSA